MNFIQRNSLFRANYWHNKFLIEKHEKWIHTKKLKLNKCSMIAPVEKQGSKFEIQYSFRILNWILSEYISRNEGDI